MTERRCRVCDGPMPKLAPRDRHNCSPECAKAARLAGRPEQFRENANVLASRELHRRSIDLFARLAKQRGTDEYMVAAQCGMRA